MADDVDQGTEAIGLAAAIAAVRGELHAAEDTAVRTGDVRFAVETVEIEFNVEVTKSIGGEASVKVFNLVSLGGKGEVGTTTANRVRVVLNPIGVGDKPFEVASSQAERPDGTKPERPGG